MTTLRHFSSVSRRGAFFKNPSQKSGYKGAGSALPKAHSDADRDLNGAGVSLNDVTAEVYEAVLRSTLVDLRNGMEAMLGENPGMKVKFVEGEKVHVSVDCREFVVRRGERRRLVFESPVTGVRSYGFDKGKRRWVSEEDGHDFEGLFVRDLMRHAFGVPTFVW